MIHLVYVHLKIRVERLKGHINSRYLKLVPQVRHSDLNLKLDTSFSVEPRLQM